MGVRVLGNFRRVTTTISLILIAATSKAANRDVCATCTHRTIESAISAAQSGDTIRVAAGNYAEGFSLNGNKSLRIEGGYNSSFSARDVDAYPTIIPSANIQYYNSGVEVLDGLTITGSQSQGIYAWSPNSSLTVNNCRIHDNPSSGIFINAIQSVSITRNILTANLDPTGNYSTAGIYITDNLHTRAEITDNIITGSVCRYCTGILLYNAGSDDVVSRNEVYGNSAGINVRSTDSTRTPTVDWNESYANGGDGILLQGGAPTARHNLSYNNTGSGMTFSSPAGGLITQSIFAKNGQNGLSLVGSLIGSTQPILRNNIFYSNDHGLNSSGWSGWGSTNIYPVAEYNDFYANRSSEIIHSTVYPWAFEDETPGTYGELNTATGTRFNIYHDPGFVDPNHGDFSLRPNSFLIDGGHPDDSYSGEPAPNGGRANIGLYGNTAQAEVSPGAPQITHLSAWVSGNDVVASFDTNTNTITNWITLKYNNGAEFVTVPGTSLVGDNITQGYKGARLATGSNRVVIWEGGVSSLPTDRSLRSLRVTLEHGNDSVSSTVAICSDCVFAVEDPAPLPPMELPGLGLPTPTVEETPQATPSPTSTPEDSVLPEETETPSITPTPTPTATAKPRRTVKRTPTPTPRPKKRAKKVKKSVNSKKR